MIKVFLVEDEYVVREGIKNNVDWGGNGFEFCGEAQDGEVAFPLIQKAKPDIVITDIKMPFMDGLELSKLIKKEMPLTEIIILSGYAEFDYAKEAIALGVANYLTKPINGEDLIKEVLEVAKKVEQNRKDKEITDKYNQDMEESRKWEKKELFHLLVTGNKPVSELLDMASKLGVDISSVWYNVVLVKVESLTHSLEEYSKKIIDIKDKVEAMLADKSLIGIDRNTEGNALLIKADSKEDLIERQEEVLGELKNLFENYKDDIRYFIAIGEPVSRLRELQTSFERASHAFAHRYLMEGNYIVSYDEIESGTVNMTQDFDIGNLDPRELDSARMKAFLKSGDSEGTEYFVNEYFKQTDPEAVRSNMFRQYLAMDVYFAVSAFLDEINCKSEDIKTYAMKPSDIISVESTQEYLIGLINMALRQRDSAAFNRYGDVIDEVKKYIDENYAEEDLSLNLVASHVNFSPNHLSMIFSQQTGETFIKYLTDYRMNKAKEMLKCTGKRSVEISVDVGYKDPHYFSYLFKKTQGMTPTQYRNNKTGAN